MLDSISDGLTQTEMLHPEVNISTKACDIPSRVKDLGVTELLLSWLSPEVIVKPRGGFLIAH